MYEAPFSSLTEDITVYTPLQWEPEIYDSLVTVFLKIHKSCIKQDIVAGLNNTIIQVGKNTHINKCMPAYNITKNKC